MPCTTILVGKKVSYDGSTIIARNDDGGFDTKHILIKKAKKEASKYKSVISHLEIELPSDSLKYTLASNVNLKEGIWPASGINEANVAMTATETITSNPRVVGADPYVKFIAKKNKRDKDIPGGIGEEDFLCLVLPYIRTAREGVLRTAELLEKYGTYEANGMAFSDSDEIWWLETIGGHHWIAKRVPDDRVVIMPNQFGLDNFDFEDAYGDKKENMCSSDLKEFIENYHLDKGLNGIFNPRLAFGSRTDADHIYNTPRAWYMARYFLPNTYCWDGDNADFTPESNDIPWSFVPEQKVSVEDVRYLLGSYYQGTPYNPYDKSSQKAGKYRTIGVPNSDICGILQIRGYLPREIQAVHWYSMGGSGFTACFPFYANVDALPKYISETTETVSMDYMYWQSRLIACMTDANYTSAIIHDERYYNAVFNRSMQLLNEYDSKAVEKPSDCVKLLEEANKKITDMVKEESDKTITKLLGLSSEHMKIRYHRGDN